jgi:hypothetical protein
VEQSGVIVSNAPFGVLQTALIMAMAEARLIDGCDSVPVTHDKRTIAAE